MTRIIAALIIEIIFAVPIIFALEKVQEKFQISPTLEWLHDHVFYPLVRVVLVLIFVLTAYPNLYGIDQLPELRTVLFEQTSRIHSLINWLFLVSLIIPFLPMAGIIPALIVPIQSILATALLFHWATTGVENISLLPTVWILLFFLILCVATHMVAKIFAKFVGSRIDNKINRNDVSHLVYESTLLIFQVPAILIYGFYLGSQIQ